MTKSLMHSCLHGAPRVSCWRAGSKLEVEARSLVVFGGRLETGEGGPGGGLRFGGGFEVVGEIYEEVETSPGFYLVNADRVVLVAVGVGLVVEPESYAGRIGDRSA